jgi:hypothetical protein
MSVFSGYDAVSGEEIGGLTSPPSIPTTTVPGAIQMTLLALNKLATIGQAGEVSSAYNPSFDKWDAVAKCDVPLASFRNMFVIQSDGIDIDDISNNDIRFYVDPSGIPVNISLSSAIVNNGAVALIDALSMPISGVDQIISKDYIRHLADLLFNTPYGADLFINESDLVTSVNTALTEIWTTSCVSDLENISRYGSHARLLGNTNHKYLIANTDAEDATGSSKYNICRELFRMLLSRVPSRFTDLSANIVPSSQSTIIDPTAGHLYYLPLRAGDQVLMRVVLKPSATQSSFQNATKDDEVRADTRAYIIALNLT